MPDLILMQDTLVEKPEREKVENGKTTMPITKAAKRWCRVGIHAHHPTLQILKRQPMRASGRGLTP